MTLDELIDAVEALRQSHLNLEEDCWYSCPKARSDWQDGSASCNDEAKAKGDCTCGADAQNARVDALIASVRRWQFDETETS
jgi:hypothetical protein